MTERNPFAPPTAAVSDTRSELLGSPRKIYGLGGVALAGLVGGPLAVAYLVYRNLSMMGLQRKIGISAMILVPMVAIWLYVQFHVPPDALSQLVAFLPQVALWWLGARYMLSSAHRGHKDRGGSFRSAWAGFGVGWVALGTLWIFTFVLKKLGAFP